MRKRILLAGVFGALLLGGVAGALARRGNEPPTVSTTTTVSQISSGRSNQPRYVGEMSCASAACHGQAASPANEPWRSSFAAWSAADPHRAAFAVLYAERSVEICRNLAREPAGSEPPLDDARYLRLLEARCIGCHATPTDAPASSPEAYLTGVSCESCHGPASHWLYVHFDKKWQGQTPGFQRMKTLDERAAVCVRCHVGPREVEGVTYDVDHELIAAGHPRLAFEFSSYLANLPPHWDTAADVAQHEKTFASESFHFDAWRLGQQQAARQWCAGLIRRAERGNWPDIASYECFDCHHDLHDTATASLAPTRSTGLPRPASHALDQWRVIRQYTLSAPRPLPEIRADLARQFRAASPADAAQRLKLLQAALQGDSLVPPRPLSVQQRLEILLALANQQPMSWDQAVQCFLAVEAFRADLPPPPEADRLAQAAAALQEALLTAASGGDSKLISQYAAPAAYDFQRVRPALEQVTSALRALQSP